MRSLAGSLLTVTLLSVMAISLEIPVEKVSEDFEESSADITQNDEETDLYEEYEYEDYDDEYDDYDEDYEDEDESDYHDDEKEE